MSSVAVACLNKESLDLSNCVLFGVVSVTAPLLQTSNMEKQKLLCMWGRLRWLNK